MAFKNESDSFSHAAGEQLLPDDTVSPMPLYTATRYGCSGGYKISKMRGRGAAGHGYYVINTSLGTW